MERVALICDRYSFDELKSWVKEGMVSTEKDGIHVVVMQDDLIYVTWNNNVCYVGEGEFLIKDHMHIYRQSVEQMSHRFVPWNQSTKSCLSIEKKTTDTTMISEK